MVLSSAVMVMVVDVATTAVSGLSCYYFSVVVTMVHSSAVMAVDVITLDADANLDRTHKKRSACLHSSFYYLIIRQLILHLSTLLHMVQYGC